MEKLITALIAALSIVAIIILVLLYGTFVWGFVLYKFWAWFVIPVFTTLPLISYIQAVGLMFIINLFKGSGTQIKEQYKDKNLQYFTVFFAPWIVLFFGYLIHVIF